MNPELDSAFRLTVQKNAFQPPHSFAEAVRSSYAGETSFQSYLDAAEDTYRGSEDERVTTHVPGDGIPKDSAKKVAKLLSAHDGGSAGTRKVRFEWVKLPEQVVFEVDRDRAVLQLNQRYRSVIAGDRSSKADAPLFKVLLFFLSRDVDTLDWRGNFPAIIGDNI